MCVAKVVVTRSRPPADLQQIAEMHGAGLVVVVLRRQDRQHFAADDPGLDEGVVFSPTNPAL